MLLRAGRSLLHKLAGRYPPKSFIICNREQRDRYRAGAGPVGLGAEQAWSWRWSPARLGSPETSQCQHTHGRVCKQRCCSHTPAACKPPCSAPTVPPQHGHPAVCAVQGHRPAADHHFTLEELKCPFRQQPNHTGNMTAKGLAPGQAGVGAALP